MHIDFRRISGPRGSKADNFALMCEQLIMAEWPEAKPVDGRGGDQGLDSYIKETDGRLKAYQFKYFCDGIGRSQKTQIKRSLETAIQHHELSSWTIVLPVNLNLYQQRWFNELREEYVMLHMDWWGETKLMNLLSKHRGIASDFFEPPDAPLMREMLLKQDRTIAAIGDIQNTVDLVSKVLQIQPKREDIDHRRALEFAANDILTRSRLSVLVWGPGKQAGDQLYQKRLQIRDKLRELGHEAEFSEEILKTKVLAAGGINLSVAELLQARWYEYIVCIMGSAGSIGEVHDFCRDPEIAHKMTICVDERHLSGYSAQGVLRVFEGNHGHLETYRAPEDITTCRLLERAVDQVEKRAAAKQDHIARIAGG